MATSGNVSIFDQLKDQLRFSRTGSFYKLTNPLTKKRYEALISAAAKPAVSQEAIDLSGLGAPEVKVVRSATLGSWLTKVGKVQGHGTLFLQPVLVPAGVATNVAALKELRFAHLLILEGVVKKPGGNSGQRYAFVNSELLEDHHFCDMSNVELLSRGELLNPFLSSTANVGEEVRIEELSMRMMNTSRFGLRRKVVEAYNVEESVSSLGLHRSIPGAMKLRLSRDAGVGGVLNISTARYSLRAGSSRVKLSTLTQWFAECIVRLDADKGVHKVASTFLAEMAEPLDSLDGIEPSSLLLDFAALEEVGLNASLAWQPSAKTPSAWVDDTYLRHAFDEPIALRKVAPPAAPVAGAGRLAVGPAPSIPVRRYEGVVADRVGNQVKINVEVEGSNCRLIDEGCGLGDFVGDAGPIPFDHWVTRTKAMRVSFDGGRVLAVAGGAYRSGNLKLAVQRLVASIRGVQAFDAVTSEKGDDVILTTDTSFPNVSCFHVIETDADVSKSSSTLICGDANVEVFDYLEIDEGEKRLRWFHAKVRTDTSPNTMIRIPMGRSVGSLSASGLQEVVGQAIKNLAFLRRDPDDPTFRDEVARWRGRCSLPRVAKIDRLRRGSSPGVKVRRIVEDPLAQHEVAIVVPSYSKSKLVTEFNRIESGRATQYGIQLFWLLSGFTQACLEVGVRPLVFTRP